MVYFVSETFLLQGVFASESDVVAEDIKRLNMCVSNELYRLSSAVGDWSNWDDTYQFIEDNNTDFIANNIILEVFRDLGINLMAYINLNGTIVSSKVYDLTSGTEIPFSFESIAQEYDFNVTQDENPQSGIIKTEDGLLMISYSAILKSNYEGPTRGVLIFGRYLDSEEINLLSETIGLQIKMLEVDDLKMPADFLQANNVLTTGTEITSFPLNETTIAGYIFFNDINSQPIAIVRIFDNRNEYIQTKTSITYLAISVAIIGIILTTLILALLEKFVLARLTKLSQSVEGIALESSFMQHIELRGDDELSSLAEKTNHMLDTINDAQLKLHEYASSLEEKVNEKTRELIEAQNKIVQNERLAVIGQMAAMVAHDLRNPLFGIKNATFVLKRRDNIKDDEAIKKILILIDESLENAIKIVNDLLDYSREIRLEKQTVTLSSLISSTLLETRITDTVHLTNSVDSSLEVNVDVAKMKRVFVNLINNAIDAMPDGGKIEIKSQANQGNIQITFADSGKGITQENLSKLWKPLFTTKTKGIGLGLVICKRFIEAHDGSINVTSEEGKGTTFTINLPIAKENNPLK